MAAEREPCDVNATLRGSCELMLSGLAAVGFVARRRQRP